MSNFRQIDRETGFLLPPSVKEWLPEHHLARFIVEVVAGLDLRSMSGSYRGSGSASYHPEVLLGLLVYGYATGVFSSRKLERARYDSVAFRFIAGRVPSGGVARLSKAARTRALNQRRSGRAALRRSSAISR
jgi:transposase